MKAMVQDTYGSAEVLRMADVDRPEPGAGEVLVRVRAVGVDQGVWHLMAGEPYLVRLVCGLRAPRARVRGAEMSGTVAAVGAGVTGFAPGAEVFGSCDGAFAEYVCGPADRFAPKPAGLSFEQAAALPISGATAIKALREVGKLAPGQRVLVIGAGGGVGTYAVQLAKAWGAHVTGVCSTSKVDLVRSIGADEVVDYTREDFADRPERYDLIVDTAGNRTLAHLRRALTPRGTAALVGGENHGRWVGSLKRTLRATLLSPFVRHRLVGVISLHRNEDLVLLSELVAAGKLKPVVERSFPLAEAADAVRHLEAGRARGKVVLTV